jgi:hypothetical protein
MRIKKLLTSFAERMTVIMLLSLLFLPCSSLLAAEYPVPSYEGEELQKLLNWEETWVGKKVTSANVDQVKDFLTESYFDIVSNPEKWGEIWFEIAPYQEIKPTSGMIEATRKYAGTCKIGPDGLLQNWVHGIPFPEPKTALEVMWDFDAPTHGDTLSVRMVGFQVDGRRHYDREMISATKNMWFTGRTDVAPLPEIAANSKRIRKAGHTEWIEPKILKGDRNLSIRWEDPLRDWGSWGFSSSNRRVTRRSSAFRWAQLGGSDMTLDDGYGYDYEVVAQKYKSIGRKDLLVPRHNNSQDIIAKHVPGNMWDSGFKMERVNTFVIEAQHKDPNYIYGKQIYYIDPETWLIVWADKYDPDGKLWKVFQNSQELIKQNINNEKKSRITYTNICDLQRLHATIGGYPEVEISDSADGPNGRFFTPNYYMPKALVKYGY